jgi:hypothetical protein
METGHGQAFRTGVRLAGGGFIVVPVLASPGIEEHAGYYQVKGTAGPLGRVKTCEQLLQMRQPIDPTSPEVTPATVPGNVQRRVRFFYDRYDIRRARGQLLRRIAEVLQAVRDGQR